MEHDIRPHFIITITSHKNAKNGIKRNSDRANGEVEKEEEGDGEEKSNSTTASPPALPRREGAGRR
jgi:hypothetical protein